MNSRRLLIIYIIIIITGCSDSAVNNSKNNRDIDEKVAGIASEYPDDKGIEQNPNVLFASGFEDGFNGWTRYNEKVSQVVDDAENAFGGSNYLQTTATRGVNTGGDVVYKLSEGVDQLYLRFYAKFDKNTVMPHHFVKIRAFYPEPYWGNAGQRPRGDEAFWTGIEPTSEKKWQFYTYWHEMHSWQTYEGKPNPERGDNPYYGNVFRPDNQTPFEREEWICVEAMMKANTPGESDGELAFWINGVKQGEWKPGVPEGVWRSDKFLTTTDENLAMEPFEGFNFRTDERVKINEISLQWYVSEKFFAKGTADENIVYFDDVVVATEYIGPKYKIN